MRQFELVGPFWLSAYKGYPGDVDASPDPSHRADLLRYLSRRGGVP